MNTQKITQRQLFKMVPALFAGSTTAGPANALALADQLHKADMTAAAWLVESLAARIEELQEELEDLEVRIEDVEDQLNAATVEQEELESYKHFFGTVVDSFEGFCGGWPAASPDDQALLEAIEEAFKQAGKEDQS